MSVSRIKNREVLARDVLRSDALTILEAGYTAIDTQTVIKRSVTYSVATGVLTLVGEEINLSEIEKIFFFGFGKGSGRAACAIREILGERLAGGVVIDKVESACAPIQSFVADHPVPSERNVVAGQELARVAESLGKKDLAIVAVMGGGSALLCASQDELIAQKTLYERSLREGANIHELNLERKRVGLLKGGGLAKLLYPARVVGMIFSDVFGGRPEDVASGPTYRSEEKNLDAKYFERVTNKVLVSNESSLIDMSKEAERLGYRAVIVSEPLCNPAHEVLEKLKKFAQPGTVVLGGGEVRVLIGGERGIGGRCSYVGLSSVGNLTETQLFIAAASDGSDNGTKAGVLADSTTSERMEKAGVDVKNELEKLNTLPPFEKIGDVIETGRTGANVSDWYILATAKQ